MTKPILITGIHRSGSTWLANMLCLANNTQLIDEPFNLGDWAFKLNGLATNWFTHLPDINESEGIEAFKMVLENRTRLVYRRKSLQHWFPFFRKGRQIIKDPIASFSSEALSKSFDMQVIVLVRHPLAFVSSIKRMNWEFPINHFTNQSKLMRDYLNKFRNEIDQYNTFDETRKALLVWKCIYYVLNEYLKGNPNWIMLRHEDLSRNTIDEFKSLYSELGLEWTSKIEAKIKSFSNDENPVNAEKMVTHQMKRNSNDLTKNWVKHYTMDEIREAKDYVSEVSDLFYDNRDWELD